MPKKTPRRTLTPLERLRRWLCPVHGTALTQDCVDECEDVGACPRKSCSFWVPTKALRELEVSAEVVYPPASPGPRGRA